MNNPNNKTLNAGKYKRHPQQRPIAEAQKIIAAVVSPFMFTPCFKIAPAPIKPIPLTTPAAMRVESPEKCKNLDISKDNMLKRQEEIEINIKVLIPTIS